MARIDILAPVEVRSFTKQRARFRRRSDPAFVTIWGEPSRFDFSPQASDLPGPQVVPPEDGADEPDNEFRTHWGHGEKVWIGHEVFRDASMALSGEAGMPIDAEGIRTATFDCGERTIVHEEKRLVGNTTVIYPTIEHCREYVELELDLVRVLSRGTPPPPDIPPPPLPPEIEEAPIIEEAYDWAEPAFTGDAIIPAVPNRPQEVVELGAFRTPIRFAAGEPVIVMAYFFSWGMTGGTGPEDPYADLRFTNPNLGDVEHAAPDGRTKLFIPDTATAYAQVGAFSVASDVSAPGFHDPGGTQTYGMIAWAIKPAALRAKLVEAGDTSGAVRFDLRTSGSFVTGGEVKTTINKTGHRVITRSNPAGTGTDVLQGLAEWLITLSGPRPNYFANVDSTTEVSSLEGMCSLYRPYLAHPDWAPLGDRIGEAEFTPPMTSSSSTVTIQTYEIDMETLQIVPVG